MGKMSRQWKRGLCAVLAVSLSLMLCSAGALGETSELTAALLPTESKWDTFWQEYWTEHDELTWVTVGDSITAGNMGFVRGYKSYFDWMQQRLNQELGKHVTLVNTAVGGSHLYQYADSAEERINRYEPDIVTVYFGGNDHYEQIREQVKDGLDRLLEQIVPTAENVADGMNPERVVVLIACQPQLEGMNAETIESIRALHAYGQAAAARYEAQGFRVQYIDAYDYFENKLPYGKAGCLASIDGYIDGVHPNGVGQYAIAQYLMGQMGIYSAESELCTLPHESLGKVLPAPGVSLDYTLAGRDTDGVTQLGEGTLPALGELNRETPGYGTVLLLGGAATAGEGMELKEYNTFAGLLTTYLRNTREWTQGSVVTAASGDYDSAWFSENLEGLMARYGMPELVLYMPEISGIYEPDFTYSPEKVQAFGSEVAELAARCRGLGAELLLITPFPMPDQTINGWARGYVDKLITVGKSEGVPVCNLYTVLDEAMEEQPQVARNWFDGAGYPNYIAHTEAAKTILRSAAGLEEGPLFLYTYRGVNPGGLQQDRFSLSAVQIGGRVEIDLSGLLRDPLYRELDGALAEHVSVEQGDRTLPVEIEDGILSLPRTLLMGSSVAEVFIHEEAATRVYSFTPDTLKQLVQISAGAYSDEGAGAPDSGVVQLKRADGSGYAGASGRILVGDTILVSAKAKEGYQFTGWVDGETGEKLSTAAEYELTAERDMELRAVFETERMLLAGLTLEAQGIELTLDGEAAQFSPNVFQYGLCVPTGTKTATLCLALRYESGRMTPGDSVVVNGRPVDFIQSATDRNCFEGRVAVDLEKGGNIGIDLYRGITEDYVMELAQRYLLVR